MLQGGIGYRIKPSLNRFKSKSISNGAYILYSRVYSLLNFRSIQTSVFLRRHSYSACAGTGQDIKHIDIFNLREPFEIHLWEGRKGEEIVISCKGSRKWDFRTRVY